eukprot:CAMPEP_0201937928 /NCGR_PEP_ID=MMETSP0903-20130614/40436_1 /ASSEMBLY_ACC=CAM_ASM_000552 /TAXON_ID=420261 /ORGANISM="Thalassiosira antarctica, Strain CCMP982" /LENGTH=337 /DNA_ID=CAMNT_0048479055 /DNA_START=15 /DNA_END=1028 /DNA_ORIENTATION=+
MAHAFVSSVTPLKKNRHHLFAIETFIDMDNMMEFDIGVCNIPGVDWQRPGKVNQDWCFIDEQLLMNDGRADYSVVGVLDGHGKFGHEISSFAAKNMANEIFHQLTSCSPELPVPGPIIEFERQAILNSAGFDCSEYKSTCSRTQQALINAFHAVHFNAIWDEKVKAGRNGATCIVCHIDHLTKECNVAYVGDSRAICIGSDNSISVIANELTVDLPSERQRIESSEGRIVGRNNVFYGPIGIAMTRALGDAVMVRAGVIPTPMVGSFQLNKGDTLVLATDGIWDVLTNEQVMDIALNHASAQDAADDIAKAARERWIGDLPIMDEDKADDITIMVLK